MPKESFALRACDFVAKYSIYALVFLVPIFFLPWTSDALDFNKQAVLIFLSFLAFFAWMAKAIALKKICLNPSKIHIAVAVFFVVYFASTVFSLWGYGICPRKNLYFR